MKRYILPLLLIVPLLMASFLAGCAGSKGKVEGSVIATGPIASASVILYDTAVEGDKGIATTTDTNGFFSFSTKPGRYRLAASAVFEDGASSPCRVGEAPALANLSQFTSHNSSEVYRATNRAAEDGVSVAGYAITRDGWLAVIGKKDGNVVVMVVAVGGAFDVTADSVAQQRVNMICR